MLAAGTGERLRPLTWLRPKVLCPVGNVPLLDHNLARVAAVTDSIAVNVHHHRVQLEDHLAQRHPAVHVSVEEPAALGTAGALGRLRDWIAGRAVLVVNGDAWTSVGLAALVEGWDGEKARVLVPEPGGGGGPFDAHRPVAGALMAWRDVANLRSEPSGLFASVWAPARRAGRLEVVVAEGPFVDCGTPASYLAANLLASGGASVIGDGAVIDGEVIRSVVWPGVGVRANERLVDAIRASDEITVLIRS